MSLTKLFNLEGKVALITGGNGVLGSHMAQVLAENGAIVGVLGRSKEATDVTTNLLLSKGYKAFSIIADVLNEEALIAANKELLNKYGRLDILINAAGGNMPGATIPPDKTIFDLQIEDLKKVVDLNLIGTILPTKIFSEIFDKQKKGIIINISSASASRPLTRVMGYSASKAAVDNFTKWMAVEMATKFGEGVRVNAIAPGFFIGEQNRALLTNPDGSLTARGQKIIEQTPMKRFGVPEDLSGTLLYLCSDASKFVTGSVINVDGGFAVMSI